MSSQTTVVTTSGKKRESSAQRKKRLTKYVSAKRMATKKSLASKRKSDVGTLVTGYRQTIMPERFITTLETSLEFYIGAANLDQINGNYLDIRVNSIVQPFNTTYTPGSLAPVYSMNGSYINGYNQTTGPIGYNFFTATYTKYKVLGYKVKVSIMTGTNSDVLEAVMLPIGQAEIPNAASGNVNSSVLKGQPKAVSRLCHNGGPNNDLYLKGSIYELLGMRKQQWLDLDGTTPPNIPSVPGYIGLYLMSLTGTTNSQPVTVCITMHQILEFTDLNNGNFLS